MIVFAFSLLLTLPSFGGETRIQITAPGAYTESIALSNCERLRKTLLKEFKAFTLAAEPGVCESQTPSTEPS